MQALPAEQALPRLDACCRLHAASHPYPRRYQAIAAAHPANVECLRYAARLSADLGRHADSARYSEALERAERAAAAAAAAAASRGDAGGGGSDELDGGGEGLAAHVPDAADRAGPEGAARGRAAQRSGGVEAAAAAGDVWGAEALGDDMLPM
jgi:hypothetical protein